MKRALIFGLFAYGLTIAPLAAQDFFKGNVLKIVVGNSVGGAMDDWARLIALYLGKHIPGNPDILVQNMPGAASIIAANHVYNIGKPDGLTLGLINPVIYIDQLLGAKEVRFDWKKFAWIGSPEKMTKVYISAPIHPTRPWKTSGKPTNRRAAPALAAPAWVISCRSFLKKVSGSKSPSSPATAAAVR